MIPLRSKVRDKVTEFTGIVTGRAEYLFRTPEVRVQPSYLKDGVPVKGEWLAEDRLEVLPDDVDGKIGFCATAGRGQDESDSPSQQ